MIKTIDAYKEEIIYSINEIEKYTHGLDISSFVKNTQVYNATMMCLALIGETASKLPESVRNQNTVIPWSKIISLRNRISHDYFSLDEEVLWQTIKESLPELKIEIQKLHD